MSRLFDLDSPIVSFLSRLADLVWLNLLTLICCIPIVTAGAAITALHYVTVKMVRNEDGYLTRSYFKSFKENFLQATGLWLLFVLILAVAVGDFYFINMMDSGVAFVLRTALAAVFFFYLCGAVYWFALLSRFENTIKNTIKNACLLGILNFPKTICILIIYAVFGVLYAFFSYRILPLVFLLGISVPVYLTSYLYSGIFKKLEPSEDADKVSEEEIGQSV